MFGGLRSNKLYIPLITILGSVALFFAYSVFYVSWQRTYANERAFRLLSVVGDQLGKRFANLKSVLAAALVDSPDGDSETARHHDPSQYLKEVAGSRDEIQVVKSQSPCPESWKREGELTLVLADPGAFSLRAEFQATGLDVRKHEACFVHAYVKPAVDLRERFHNLTADYFDDILISTSEGDVLFESNVSGIRISNLDTLVALHAVNGSLDKSSQGAEKSNKTPRDFGQFSNVTNVKLAGSVYRLYVQPVPLRIQAGGTDKRYLKILVCGLWRTDRQESEVVSIPHSTLIWAVLVVLAIFGMIWPVLKVAYMSPAERLKRTHVFYLLSSGLFITSILTALVLNRAYTVRAGDESRDQLATLAAQIDTNVKTELARALTFMNALESGDPNIDALMRKATRREWTGARFLENPFFHQAQPNPYPYFDNVFWTDSEGNQLYKLTVRGEATPQTSVQSEPYFQYVRDALPLDQHPHPAHLKTMDGVKLPSGLEISETTCKTPFRFEGSYSPNTGEFFVVLAKPSDPRRLPAYFKRASVEVLVTPFLSLVDPVMPTGLGYAIVDHDGLVQFHSSVGRNQIEDFFKESREDPGLKSLVINGTSDYLNVDYNGKRQLMLVRPLEYLSDPALSLIVFRDTNYFTAVNVASMSVFGLLAAVLALPFLAGLALHIFRASGYPLECLWPCEDDCPTYVQIVVANVCLAVAFVIRYPDMETAEILRAVLAIGAVIGFFALAGRKLARVGKCALGRAVVLLAILLVGWRGWALLPAAAYAAACLPPVSAWLGQLATSARKVNVLYSAAVFSVLTVLVVLPCFGLFKVSYHSVNRLALEAEQLDRLDLLNHRAEGIRENYTALERTPNATGNAIAGALEPIFRQRMAEKLDRYDEAAFWPFDVLEPQGTKRDLSSLEKKTAWLAGWFSSTSLGAQLRETAMADRNGNGLAWQLQQSGDDEVLEVSRDFHGTVPEGRLRGVYPLWQVPPEAVLLMALLAPVLIGWLSYMIRKVFLTDLAKVPPLDNWVLPDRGDRNLLIVGHPKSGKSTLASQVENKDTVDLAQLTARCDWTLPKLKHSTLIVDNFEFDIDNPDTCLAKLRLLEDLIYLRNKRVIILSAVDPLFYIFASSPEIVTPRGGSPEPPAQILDRWAGVLSSFSKFAVEDSTRKYLDTYAAERARQGSPCPPDMIRLIQEECDGTAQLRKIGLSMLDASSPITEISKAALVEELLDRADAYYRTLWSTCTKEERLVLFQLARDGWANPKNQRAIQQLERRRLVRRSPGLRIMNESFRRFVSAAQLPAEVAHWEEDEQQSAWSALRLALSTAALMAGGWLLYTQQDVFQMGIGYVAAMGTASGTVLTLVHSIIHAKPAGIPVASGG